MSARLNLASHALSDTHTPSAGEHSDPTNPSSTSKEAPSGHSLPSDHAIRDTHGAIVARQPSDPTIEGPWSKNQASGHSLSDDHPSGESHLSRVVADTPAADQRWGTTHAICVGGTTSTTPSTIPIAITTNGASTGWLELRIWAEMFNDAQLQRIAATNRAERGGVDPGLYLPYLEMQERAEHVAKLGMVRCYRRVVPAPIRAWQKTQPGIGDHTLARLLGHLGHPVYATPHHWEGTGSKRTLIADEPYDRTIGQLWQYCGHGDPARRVRKGITADELAGLGKPDLKMIVHLIAEACMKQKDREGADYRDVYDARRLATLERLHAAPCIRCGPSGKPAAEGSPWSKAHQHADALRIVGKELLRDLWLVAL